MIFSYDDYELSTLKYVAENKSEYEMRYACYALARRYDKGTGGVTKDINQRIYWLKKSAEYGCASAMYELGVIYTEGKGVAKNESLACKYIDAAADLYDKYAARIAGKGYYVWAIPRIDYEKAAKYLKIAAFKEDPESMYYLSMCYANGHGVKQDSTKAYIWANRAIENGYNDGYYALGLMYEDGLSFKKNPNEALWYYNKGAESDINSPNCKYRIGLSYLTGSCTQIDTSKALEYLIPLANENYINPIARLCWIYEEETSRFHDVREAAKWRQKQFDLGNHEFAYNLTSCYRQLGDFNATIPIYETIAKEGDYNAYNSLAYLYAEGKLGYHDYDKALAYLEKAIAGNPSNSLEYLDSRGEIFLMKGDIKSAEKTWKSIIKQDPNYYSKYIANGNEDTVLNKFMKENSKTR